MFDEDDASRHEIAFPIEMDPDEMARAMDALAAQAIMPLGFTLELDRAGARAHVWAADPENAVEALETAGFDAEPIGRSRAPAAGRSVEQRRRSLGRSS